jgi:hypothetical protein
LNRESQRRVTARGRTSCRYRPRPISDWLTDEQKAAFNLNVPSELTPRPAFATGILFFRKHLPQQLVGGAWMPLLMHPETRAMMVVPRQFWVREISATWQAR